MTLRLPPLEQLRFAEAKTPEIRIRSWSSVAVTVLVQLFTQHGFMTLTHSDTGDRSSHVSTHRIPDFPVALITWTSPVVRRGQTYIKCELRLGGVVLYNLVEGYHERGRRLTWPPGVREPFVSGSGYLHTVVGADPAAGSEISVTVPTNARWRLHAIRFELVTSTAVATRRVNLIVDDGANRIFERESPATQDADRTRRYNYAAVGYSETAFTANDVVLGIPPLWLFQGWRIRTRTSNLQSGDDYAAPVLCVEEWLEE